MVMVIKSNVPSNIIANPDGWNPPFNTDGLLYAGIYGRGNLSKNFAAGGADAVVSGSPVVAIILPLSILITLLIRECQRRRKRR